MISRKCIFMFKRQAQRFYPHRGVVSKSPFFAGEPLVLGRVHLQLDRHTYDIIHPPLLGMKIMIFFLAKVWLFEHGTMLGVTWRCLQKKGVTEACFYFLQDFVNPQGAMKGACPLLHFLCWHLGRFNYPPPQRSCLLFMIHDVSVWKYVWKWGNRPKPLQTLCHFTWGNTDDLGTQKNSLPPS